MRICYILLSQTFGMHQYTADMANRLARAGHDVHLVTTRRLPRDRYAPAVTIHAPIETSGTGFSREGLQRAALREVQSAIEAVAPDIVHFTGPHLWNVVLVRALAGQEIPVVHTLHDLDPHRGVHFGLLIRLWNRLIVGAADQILVHGQTYRQRLLGWGLPPERITWTPLLHLFVGSTWLETGADLAASVTYEPWALFFGRIERYKGIEHLVSACAMMQEREDASPRVVVAGGGDLSALWTGPLPDQMSVVNRRIDDQEAMDLFSRCGIVVLPYTDASQSALIAAAYYFRKPVLVTRSGALPEYVVEGHTGCIVEPGHPATLARSIERLLSDPARLARMGAAGRTWYDAHRAEEERALMQMYLDLGAGKGGDGLPVGPPEKTHAHPPQVAQLGPGAHMDGPP